MKKPSFLYSSLIGLFLGLPLIALFYLGMQTGIVPFVPFNLFDWLSRILPSNLINVTIETIVRIIHLFGLGPTDTIAKQIEQFIAIGIFLTFGAATGFLLAILGHFFTIPIRIWGIATGVTFSFLSLLLLSPQMPFFPGIFITVLLIIAWTTLLSSIIVRKPFFQNEQQTISQNDRRSALFKLVGVAVAFSAGTSILARTLQRKFGLSKADISLEMVRPSTRANYFMKSIKPVEIRTGIAPAPGTRPEVTSNEQFYRIDIDTTPPMIDVNTWRLSISGMFKKPVQLTYTDILEYPEVTEPVTLCCISNPIGGDLISTGFFTGIRLSCLLSDLGISKEASLLAVRAVDGYYESITFEDMYNPHTLLVYGMNGYTLSAEQGFPLRFYIPNRYGMKQPKWISSIKALRNDGNGFWVDRGWNRQARPQTLSIIDTVAKDHVSDGKIPVGGIAWAGDRGIQSVELQIDNGTWQQTELLTPALGPLTWVLWRHDWPAEKGNHHFKVRASDGNGDIQSGIISSPFPSGATGYHEVDISI